MSFASERLEVIEKFLVELSEGAFDCNSNVEAPDDFHQVYIAFGKQAEEILAKYFNLKL